VKRTVGVLEAWRTDGWSNPARGRLRRRAEVRGRFDCPFFSFQLSALKSLILPFLPSSLLLHFSDDRCQSHPTSPSLAEERISHDTQMQRACLEYAPFCATPSHHLSRCYRSSQEKRKQGSQTTAHRSKSFVDPDCSDYSITSSHSSIPCPFYIIILPITQA